MKAQRSSLFSFLFLILLSASCLKAQAAEEKNVVRVGFFEFSGYHMQDEDGRRSGYGYDFLQKIGNYMDCSYEYIGYDRSYKDALSMLENGEIDLLTSVSKTPEREEKFLFSNKSIGTNSTIFTVKAGNTAVTAGDYDSYQGLRIGMLRGNSKNEGFALFAKRHDFTYTPVYYETEDELTAALQGGAVDGAVTGSLRATENEWIIESLNVSSFYAVTNADDQALMNRINYAISQLDLNEPDWRTALHQKYYSLDSGGLVMLTAGERNYLNELQKSGAPLTVLVNPDRAPYSYFENGDARGILPAIFRLLADKLSLPYEILPVADREEYYRLRKAGAADIVLDFSYDYYLAEQEGYRLTAPYLEMGFTLLTRRNHSGDIETLAALRRSESVNSHISSPILPKNIIYCENTQDCVQAVLDGQADGTILYTYAAERSMQQDIRNRLSFSMLGDTAVPYALGVNDESEYLLRSILDKTLAGIGEEEKAAVITSETASLRMGGGRDLLSFFYDNPLYAVVWILSILLFLFISLLLLLRIHNQKQLDLKIATVSDQYEKQQLALKDALSVAESANRSKSLFLFNMSHDIRTPMNAIVGFADIAGKHPDDRDLVKNALQKIQISSNILLKLINDVLELARIESGKTSLDLSRQNLADCEENVRFLFQESMEKAGIHFTTSRQIENPYVLCDYLRLNQISINLLSNAQKFTPKGGHVSYAIRQLGAPDGQGNARYRILVKDDGIGMSEEFQSRMFHQFERERSSTVSGIQGTGLGLAIVKRIADMMNAEIEVRSELGAGTEFTVTLTLRVLEETPENDTELPAVSEQIDFSGKRILLVEDNEINREIASEILQEEGFLIEEAEDGTVAVEKITHAPAGYYDLILMDIQMPIMDGYKATQEIRRLKDTEKSSVPIVAMTANAFEEDRKMALAAGMNAHLAKPIDVAQMIDVLRKILSKPK